MTYRSETGISIHAPRTGSDKSQAPSVSFLPDFNPRSPHGERHAWNADTPVNPAISIHAPRTGSDAILLQPLLNEVGFQSTLPARGATSRSGRLRRWKRRFQSTLPARGATMTSPPPRRNAPFQSTLPARGATRVRDAPTRAVVISIHAPRTGSDRGWCCGCCSPCNFNPRSPHGERLTSFILLMLRWMISIHAPRTGSDVSSDGFMAGVAHFNPRSPHGERRRNHFALVHIM